MSERERGLEEGVGRADAALICVPVADLALRRLVTARHMIDADLSRADRRADRTELMDKARRARRRASALGHTIHIEEVNVDRSKVLCDLPWHRRGGREARDALVEAERLPDLA